MKTLEQRFLDKVPIRPAEGCWLWAASTSNDYGQIMVRRADGTPTMNKAHRVAFELFIRPLDSEEEVDHFCEVKNCVRWTYDPALGSLHLEAVTHEENMRRATVNGRMHNRFNAAKTHCPQNHEYTEANTYRYGNRRVCKTCANTKEKVND